MCVFPDLAELLAELEQSDHGMSVAEWAALLSAAMPALYLSTRPPLRPTKAAPGTEAKIRELERRAAAGLSLFHPADPVIDPSLRHARFSPGRGVNGRDKRLPTVGFWPSEEYDDDSDDCG